MASAGPPGDELALQLFLDHVLQHLYVETQIGYQLLQPGIPRL